MVRGIDSFVNSFNAKLEQPVRQHLKNVYGTLTMTTTLAAVGSYAHFYTPLQAGFLTSIGALGTLMGLCLTPDNGKNMNYRLGLLFGFAFLSGISLGPILQVAMFVNPAIIMTALLSTILVFVSFTLSAIFSPRGYWLYLGGILATVLSSMFMLSLLNIFVQSVIISKIHLYLGLASMSAFVLFDTQAIIEKRRAGNKDYIAHSLDLFIDFLQVFKHLMIILMEKEERRDKRKNN